MSLQAAKAFIERMKTDEDFRKRVTECKDAETRQACVFKEGFDFTKEELKSVKAELGDDELQRVAGGAVAKCKIWYCTPENRYVSA